MSKVWNFLLPESGVHQLGLPGQQVFIDGVLQTAREGHLIYAGPGSSLLELRYQDRMRQWTLLVNGLAVEEYNSGRRQCGDESLRELRSRPDGSYLIQPVFDAPLDLNAIRKFRFKACGRLHEVELTHEHGVWEVIADKKVIDRKAHGMTDMSSEVRFDIQAADGQLLDTCVRMRFSLKEVLWKYFMSVNGVDIPACWTKTKGDIPDCGTPIIVSEAETALDGTSLPHRFVPECVKLERIEVPSEDAKEEELPQGVSFDAALGSYQANVKGKSGKFIFLGEFGTAAEAHAKYLEALPIHCPDKRVVPDIPA